MRLFLGSSDTVKEALYLSQGGHWTSTGTRGDGQGRTKHNDEKRPVGQKAMREYRLSSLGDVVEELRK